ncbi:MAG TPA: adenosylcobinamide-GDP ribazoletransferase [Geminicoccaceae bacterium]|nr:adenosylcobinamide-GDP ribazoletransferase [Geminicoccaceae bacterium]
MALRFLTRLPAGSGAHPPPDALAASVPAFPLVGALVGAAGALAFALGARVGLPPPLAALLAVAAQILLTGGLHEDGLADLADGFGGGRTRVEKLRIMRDPRIGSFGALALVLVLLARVGALATLADPRLAAAVLIAAAAASRAMLPVVMTALPPARGEGLAAGAGRPHPLRAAAGVAIAILVASILLAPALAASGLIVAAFAALLIAGLARRQIGGHTGDVLGAAQQLAETGFLLAAAAIHPMS